MTRHRFALAAALLTSFCPRAAAAAPQTARPTEYQVKAAYLSNFGRFVEWPPAIDPAQGSGEGGSTGNAEPFNICILGADPFGPDLDHVVAGQKINRSRLAARRISKVQDAPGCRILFIGSSEDKRLKLDLAALENEAILTVSDFPDFTDRGGMIQFVLDGSHVRFEVNRAAAQHAGLNLSSELVKLAIASRKDQ